MLRRSPKREFVLGVRLSLTALAFSAAVPTVAASSMWDLLPGDATFPGWRVVPGTERKASTTAGLYAMYDGAVPDLQQAGVVAAGQRIYSRDNRRVTVDLFRFATVGQARAYYVQRKSEISQTTSFAGITGLREAGCYASISRTSVAYLWCRGYYASLSVNGSTPDDRATLKTFAQYISKRVMPPPKPR
mgnify:CR=1 FL=1